MIRKKGTIRPDFNRSIKVDFQGATLFSDTGFLLLREIDERFGVIEAIGDTLADTRSPSHTKHSIVQMIRQRVYQIAAGYEDCNDADFLRVDPVFYLNGKLIKQEWCNIMRRVIVITSLMLLAY